MFDVFIELRLDFARNVFLILSKAAILLRVKSTHVCSHIKLGLITIKFRD